ncbi:MAG: response regulator [Thermoproteota archaeon]|nr:response regulator [Thermoproteota archaeon]
MDRKKTVMICDDEIDLLEMFQLALAGEYKILTADSGKGCIETYFEEKKVKGEKIDILLLDYRLGDMQGDTVAKKVEELNDVKIIMISAYELDGNIVEELKRSRYIVDVIKKPVSMKSLIEKIESFLTERAA